MDFAQQCFNQGWKTFMTSDNIWNRKVDQKVRYVIFYWWTSRFSMGVFFCVWNFSCLFGSLNFMSRTTKDCKSRIGTPRKQSKLNSVATSRRVRETIDGWQLNERKNAWRDTSTKTRCYNDQSRQFKTIGNKQIVIPGPSKINMTPPSIFQQLFTSVPLALNWKRMKIDAWINIFWRT